MMGSKGNYAAGMGEEHRLLGCNIDQAFGAFEIIGLVMVD